MLGKYREQLKKDLERTIKILEVERECVQRNETHHMCNRDCDKCDLVLPTSDVLQAYYKAIICLEKMISIIEEVQDNDT